MKLIKNKKKMNNAELKILSKVQATGCNLKPNSPSNRIYTYKRKDKFTCNLTLSQLEYYFKYFEDSLELKDYCELITVGFETIDKHVSSIYFQSLPDAMLMIELPLSDKHFDIDSYLEKINIDYKKQFLLVYSKDNRLLVEKMSILNDGHELLFNRNISIIELRDYLQSVDSNNEFMKIEI